MAAVSGVYRIVNLSNGMFYVGSSSNIHRRKRTHFKMLLENRHENQYLQRAFNKYGKDNFVFEKLREVPVAKLLMEEQKLLDEHYGPDLYNICNIAGSPSSPGRKKTSSHRKKIAESVKQYYINNPNHKLLLSSIKLGKKLSSETREKMRASKRRGEFHHNSKLSEDEVRSIRMLYSPGVCSYGELAKKFGVDKKTIIRIVKNKTWTHLR